MADAEQSAEQEDYNEAQPAAQTYDAPVQEFARHNTGNTLQMWGNKETMNLNHLVLENILQSPYYRNKLFSLKTFHEVVDEIYYNVGHLEPWEKGTRKTTGQTGMCGGVRGVGAGGVVSTPFCILFKLFMMKLTRKQLGALLNHTDSPFIRGLGFMYIRFCQPPSSFWDWYEPYLEDEEEIDPKAGGGDTMTIGQMCKIFLTKLEWYATLFPRIPVPVQKEIDVKMREHNKSIYDQSNVNQEVDDSHPQERSSRAGERGRSRDGSRSAVEHRDDQSRIKEGRGERSSVSKRSKSPPSNRRRHSPLSSRKRNRSRSKDRHHHKPNRSKSPERHKRRRGEDGEKRRHKKSHKRRHHRSRSRSTSRSRREKKHRGSSSHHKPKEGSPIVAGRNKEGSSPFEKKINDAAPISEPNESREEGELMDDGKI